MTTGSHGVNLNSIFIEMNLLAAKNRQLRPILPETVSSKIRAAEATRRLRTAVCAPTSLAGHRPAKAICR
jgi:hypothetical protein